MWWLNHKLERKSWRGHYVHKLITVVTKRLYILLSFDTVVETQGLDSRDQTVFSVLPGGLWSPWWVAFSAWEDRNASVYRGMGSDTSQQNLRSRYYTAL